MLSGNETPTNLEALAQKVLNEVNQTVKSVRDIISYKDLPFLNRDEINQYCEKIGKEKVLSYVAHSAVEHKIQEKTLKLTYKLHDKNLLSFDIVQNLATAYCGVGECGPKSYAAIAKLIIGKCPVSVSYILLTSSKEIEDRKYNHIFVVLGNLPEVIMPPRNLPDVYAKPILPDFFSKLDKSCVLLDPLLKIIGPAYQAETLLADYLKTYQLDSIYKAIPFNSDSANALQMSSFLLKATKIGEKAKKEIILEYLKQITSYDWKYNATQETAHLSLDDEGELKKIKQQLASQGIQNIQAGKGNLHGIVKPVIMITKPDIFILQQITALKIQSEKKEESQNSKALESHR